MVTANQTIRSSDVVEVQDLKVFTSRAHGSIAVAANEDYNSVLTKIEFQLPSVDQKAAFDNTLSVPSASNPVVLKDDLTTYIPQADLGEVKDSVQNFSDLPLVGNTTGDLRPVISDNIIYRWNGSAWTVFLHSGTFDHTLLSNLNGDPAYQHISVANKTTLLAQAHIHSNEAVLDAIISAGSGAIITAAERSRIPTQNQKDAMLGTAGFPSNINRYVTNQDVRLTTTRNPYVTVGPSGSLATFTGVDAVPFENALVALDVGSATAVKAIEVLQGTFNLGGALLTWSNVAPLLMEGFAPGSVTLKVYTAGIQATGTGGPLTLKGLTFEINNYTSFAALSSREGTIFEDCTFICLPLILNQIGVILNGANSVVRRCTFVGDFLEGVQINAPNCRVEECTFNITNPQHLSVHVLPGADNVQIDHNTVLNGQVLLEASFAQVSNNYWEQSSLTCTIGPSSPSPAVIVASTPFQNGDRVTLTTTGALPAGLLVGHRYYVRNRTPVSPSIPTTSFNVSLTPAGPLIITTAPGSGTHAVSYAHFVIDEGYSTRLLSNQPEDFNQPYLGTVRTIGPVDSYADYRTNNEVGFLSAFDDLAITELEILPGTYTFNNKITIPDGCKVRGAGQGSSNVTIQNASGVTCFALGNNSTLENIYFTGTNAPLVTMTSSIGALIKRCQFNLTADASSNYAVSSTSCTDWRIEDCTFIGLRGLTINLSTRGKVVNGYFNCSNDNFRFNSGFYDQIRDNYFISTPEPSFGTNLLNIVSNIIVEGNHFLGDLPTKSNSFNSVWQSNYPAPDANNIDGVDVLEVDLQGYLQPLSGLVKVGSIASSGSIEFDADTESSAATQSVEIGGKINTSFESQGVGPIPLNASYIVQLFWTSVASTGSGNVQWQVQPVFRDAVAGLLGTPTGARQETSARTGASPVNEDSVTFEFFTTDFGSLTEPTHVSFVITRLGDDPLDTMTASAHLLDAKVLLPRD